jgi:DNA-binding transcriptional regulator YdaS (Cro superfamily)
MQNTKHPLTEYREARDGMSLEALGALLVPPANKSTVSRWEGGEVLIPIERLDEIERVTGIPRTQLRPDIFKGYEPSKSTEAA